MVAAWTRHGCGDGEDDSGRLPEVAMTGLPDRWVVWAEERRESRMDLRF